MRRTASFESLEFRRLLTALRVVNYNVLQGSPSNATEEGYFSTIFSAIGNETKAGVTQPIDLLVLQETNSSSINSIESILDSLYTDDYAFHLSPSYGGLAYGFVYNTSTLQLLDTLNLSGSFTRPPLRGHFEPVEASTNDSDFYVYSTHLKADSGGNDPSIRAAEASQIRSNADALGEGENVLIVGDFNMKNSFEGAYTNLTASGAGQVLDPIHSPGNWNNNNAFKSIHTQDPSGGGGMDDRFDLQLASGELFVSGGLDYVDGSYRAFGNNGTHTLNGVLTGTGASANVLDALRNASDHLPVVVDYEFESVPAGITINESNGSTIVAENGFSDSFSFVLNTEPTSNVTVTAIPNSQLDLGSGTGVAISHTFSIANAFTPFQIIVNASNDMVDEGMHSGVIQFSTSSSDTIYNNLAVDNLNVAITDDDVAGVTIVESGGGTDVTEGSASDSFTVVLNTIPTDDVTITLTPDSQLNLGNGQGVAVNITFTSVDALVPKIISVTAFDDTLYEGFHSGNISFAVNSNDAAYNEIYPTDLVASINDNDSASSLKLTAEAQEFGGPGFYTFEFFVTAVDGPENIAGYNIPIVFNAPGVTFDGTIGNFTPNPNFDLEFVGTLSGTNTFGVAAGTGPGLSVSEGETALLFSIDLLVSASVVAESSLIVAEIVTSGPDASTLLFFDFNNEQIANVEVGAGATFSPLIPPTITDVIISGSTWPVPFRGALGTNGIGLSLPGASQMTSLPWSNLDTISVFFSEDVQKASGADIDTANLSLGGLNIADYEIATGFGLTTSYSNGATGTGPFAWTISVAGPSDFVLDRVVLLIADSVQDAAGNALNGEWVDGASSVSGDATPGGDFVFKFNVHPGDIDGSGGVFINDVLSVNGRQLQIPGGSTYLARADIDGSGSIFINDILAVNGRQLTVLPVGIPVPPPVTPPASISSGLLSLLEDDENAWANQVDEFFMYQKLRNAPTKIGN